MRARETKRFEREEVANEICQMNKWSTIKEKRYTRLHRHHGARSLCSVRSLSPASVHSCMCAAVRCMAIDAKQKPTNTPHNPQNIRLLHTRSAARIFQMKAIYKHDSLTCAECIGRRRHSIVVRIPSALSARARMCVWSMPNAKTESSRRRECMSAECAKVCLWYSDFTDDKNNHQKNIKLLSRYATKFNKIFSSTVFGLVCVSHRL